MQRAGSWRRTPRSTGDRCIRPTSCCCPCPPVALERLRAVRTIVAHQIRRIGCAESGAPSSHELLDVFRLGGVAAHQAVPAKLVHFAKDAPGDSGSGGSTTSARLPAFSSASRRSISWSLKPLALSSALRLQVRQHPRQHLLVPLGQLPQSPSFFAARKGVWPAMTCLFSFRARIGAPNPNLRIDSATRSTAASFLRGLSTQGIKSLTGTHTAAGCSVRLLTEQRGPWSASIRSGHTLHAPWARFSSGAALCGSRLRFHYLALAQIG